MDALEKAPPENKSNIPIRPSREVFEKLDNSVGSIPGITMKLPHLNTSISNIV
jgi:hypothetical protein